MDSLISRKAAIDALADMHCKSDEDGYVWIIRSDAWGRIDALPSAEPEIIRCKDCKHSYDDIGGTFCSYGTCVDCVVETDFFCRDGERRTDDEG